jgi:hypothetical protein
LKQLNLNQAITKSSSKRLLSWQLGGWQLDFVVLSFYLLVALFFTWPLVLHFSDSVPGQAGGHDNWQMVWNLWWVRYALEHGQNPFHTNLMFWPGGTDLYLHALNALNGFLSLPVQYLTEWGNVGPKGAMAGYNFIVLWSLVVGAWGAFHLAKWLGSSWITSLLAGLAYGFSTYQFDHLLGHLNLISSEFIPFYILFFLKTLAAPNKAWIKPALCSVLFLVCNTFLELQYVLYLAFFSVLALGYLTLTELVSASRRLPWGRFLQQSWLRASTIAVVFLIITLPFSLNALHTALTNPNTVPPQQDETYSADLLAYFYPSPFQPWWGSAMQNVIRPFTAPLIEKVVFPGYTIWVLVVTGLLGGLVSWGRAKVSNKKSQKSQLETEIVSPNQTEVSSFSLKLDRSLFWIIVALVFIVLSLGRRLHINGIEYGPTLPAALIYKLPILNITRVPARFAIVALLALALLAARGLGRVALFLRKPSWHTTLAVLALVFLSLELWPAPYPLATYQVADFYQQLAADSATNYAVLDIPLNTGTFQYDTSYLEAQMTHHKALLGGYISRNPEYAPFLGAPVFNEWRTFTATPQPDILPTPAATPDPAILRYFGVRYVVIHKDVLSSKQRDAALGLASKLFPQGPISDGASLVVYAVPPASPASSVQPLNFYYPNAPDWYPVEKGAQGQFSRWAQTTSPSLKFWVSQAQTLQLEVPVWSFQQTHTLTFELNGHPLLTKNIETSQQSVGLTLNLQAGENTLTLKISGPPLSPQSLGFGPDPRSLTIAVGQIKFLDVSLP